MAGLFSQELNLCPAKMIVLAKKRDPVILIYRFSCKPGAFSGNKLNVGSSFHLDTSFRMSIREALVDGNPR